MAKEDMFKWLVVLIGIAVAYLLIFAPNVTPLPNLVDMIVGILIGLGSLYFAAKLIE